MSSSKYNTGKITNNIKIDGKTAAHLATKTVKKKQFNNTANYY